MADAVLSAFNGDDLQSTNVGVHAVTLAYQVFDPVTINLEAYIQRQLNFALGRNDDVTKPRIRANVLVKF